jgi:hypothetical protein
MMIFKMFRMTAFGGLSALCMSHDAVEALGGLYSGALLREVVMLGRAAKDALALLTELALAWAGNLLALVLT